MPFITALEPQKRHKKRLSVFVDDQFVIGVGEQVAADLGLRVGRAMTPETLREVAGAEEVHKATEAALGLLDVRARATREIETRLHSRGYEDGIIAQVVEKLQRLGLLDDAQFAAQWVEARSRSGGTRPIGRQRLKTELFQKGIAKEEIAEAIGHVSAADELVLAQEAARKKIRSMPADPEARLAEQRKLIGFLQRRGFGWEAIKAAMQTVLPASSEEEEVWEEMDS